jgi:shikimate kinase
VARSNVALVGFMCAGKSSVGRGLAEIFGLRFVETDDLVEQRAGVTIADIFAQSGEVEFRRLESEVVRDVADLDGVVIACGGGVPLREENVRALRRGARVVYLDVSPEHVVRRLGPPSDVRPLLSGPDREQRARELLAARRPLYLGAADIVVDSDELTVHQVVLRVAELLREHERTHSQE